MRAVRGERPARHGPEAFADSLVAIATSYRAGDPPSRQRRATAARQALVSAARSETGIPYPLAFEDLARIVEEAPDLGMKRSTVWEMMPLPDQVRVVEYLGDLAAASETMASFNPNASCARS